MKTDTIPTKIIILITLLLLAFQAAQAQDAPPAPSTTFALDCYEVDADLSVTIHFGYTSTGGEHFVGSGFDFITEEGSHPDVFTVTLNSYDPFPALGLSAVSESPFPGITNVRTVNVPLSVVGLPMCDQPETPSPLPAVPAATATPCAHSALNSATGQRYCFELLAGGLIPLPEALTH